MRGHTDLVRALLERGASAQWQHPETGLTPLIAAAAGGHTDTCAALLAHKPMPRIDTTELEEGETAMLAASRFNNSLTVALLLRHGADANRMNKFGQTALIQAAMHNYTAVARALLQQRNIKIDARDKNHNTAAMVAASRGSRDVMHALLSVPKTLPNLALFRPDGATPLVLAVHANSLEIVQMMLALPPPHRPSVHFAPSVVTGKANAPTPLNVAAHLGHAHIVRALLAESPPPRADFVDSLGRVAIVSASARGHVEIVRMLIASSVPPSLEVTDGDALTPLVAAATYGHHRIVELLLAHRPAVPRTEHSAALGAAAECVAGTRLVDTHRRHAGCEKCVALLSEHAPSRASDEL